MSTEATSTTNEAATIPPVIKARLDAAENAVRYMMRRLSESPEIFYHCGPFTGLHTALLDSFCLSTGKSREDAAELCKPEETKHMAWLDERDMLREMASFLKEQLRLKADAGDNDLLTIPVRITKVQDFDTQEELLVIPARMLRPADEQD